MTTPAIEIPPARPLEQATTLPPRFYTDPDVWRVEQETIFRRQWICIGRTEQVEKPGDYFTSDIVGTPLIVARGQDGVVRALSAACLHRFMPVAEGSGNRSSFQCPYHLWTYALDGQLIGAPEMERADGFEKGDCRLPEIQLEVWEGFIFVNLDHDAEALAPRLATLTEKIRAYRFGEMRTAAVLDFPESHWNWKITVENGVESYHHIGTHRDTLEPFFPGRQTYHDDVDGPYIYHVIPTRDRARLPAKFPVPADLSDDQWSQLTVVAVLPSMFLAAQPDEMDWLQVIPGPTADRHTARWWICYRPDAFDDPEFDKKLEDSKAMLTAVHVQDIDACAAVWRGTTSQYAVPGRLSHLEKGVWQFDAWVREQLARAS
jgi:phenylpropionate dioxygenase-like ring-hydroxylating dioxygenase large terminal subunit